MARLHREALPDAFLPTLGDGFLVRLYRALASEPAAVVLVAEDERGPVGFASGVPSVRRFYARFLARHGLPAAASVLRGLGTPGVLRRALETASHGAGGRGLPDAELLSIAVDRRRRGRGAGRALAEGIVRGLRDRGATEVKVVVAANNSAANRLYERVGFRPARRIDLHDGRPSNVWVYRWPSSSGSGSRSS
jgi:ribosomal protein S18 acetylase RimI-like enzyme